MTKIFDANNLPAKKSQPKQSQHRHVDQYSQTLKKEKSAKSPLKAFAPKPQKVAFDSQLENEQIVLLLRRHPVTQLKKILITLVAFFLPIIIFSTPFFDGLPTKFRVAGVLGWYMLLITFVLETFLVWFFNVFIITDERIIDVDFLSLIYKNVSSAKIENIEDITVATSGVLASIIDYGTIFIQTAGENPEIEFEEVPQPAKVAKALNELILEEEREKIEGRVR